MVCSSFPDGCADSTKRPCLDAKDCLNVMGSFPKVTCSEHGKKYILNNDACTSYVLAKYHVDGGMIRENISKCDYLCVCYSKKGNRAVFVELKGKNNAHACEQLSASIDLLKPCLIKLGNCSVYARIINTRTATNDKLSVQYKKLVGMLQCVNRSEAINVEFKGNVLEEYVDRL